MPLGAHTLSEMVVPMLINLQTRARSTAVAKLHYNLGNSLYQSMLDPYMQYSCGYFHNTEDLATAQLQKLDLICRKLQLEKSDRLLDIGCGWGGLAKYAAEKYGCRVVGVNISDAQIEFARKAWRDCQSKFSSSTTAIFRESSTRSPRSACSSMSDTRIIGNSWMSPSAF